LSPETSWSTVLFSNYSGLYYYGFGVAVNEFKKIYGCSRYLSSRNLKVAINGYRKMAMV
jgi:hypothetical protein